MGFPERLQEVCPLLSAHVRIRCGFCPDLSAHVLDSPLLPTPEVHLPKLNVGSSNLLARSNLTRVESVS
jgi:hypothetical protein